MRRSFFLFLCFYSFYLLSFQKVDINKASHEQIAIMPVLNRALAKNIVMYRQKHGFFKNSDDLLKVAGMNEKKLSALSDWIVYEGLHKSNTKKSTKNDFVKKYLLDLSDLEKIVLKRHNLESKLEDDLMNRARISGLLPRLAFLADFDQDKGTSEKKVLEKDEALISKDKFKSGFGIRATFELPNLIFNNSEIEIVKLSIKKSEEREKIINKLHKYYFKYLKLQDEREKEKDFALWPSMDLEILETESELNFLCGFAFR